MADNRAGRRSSPIIGGVALALSLAWLALLGWLFLTLEPDPTRFARDDPPAFLMTILGVVLPVALIWMASGMISSAQGLKADNARLAAAVEGLRRTVLENQQTATQAIRQEVESRIAEVARSQAALGVEIAALTAGHPEEATVLAAPGRPAPPAPQQVLALGPEDAVEPRPLPPEDFIRALNFPDNERDQEGFRVLRAALDHRPTAELVKAAQDVLTLLSQDGIYMDDLSPHRAPPALWRAFAKGARDASVAGLAGIRDRSSTALTSGRMKEDPVFRDAALQFLRMFDKVFAGFAESASDAEITRFSDTRTARAFMLLGKVTGSFG